MFHR
jgi:transposase